jgi:hypothetical protein
MALIYTDLDHSSNPSGEVDHTLELWSRSVYINAISDVMVTVLASGEVDHGLELTALTHDLPHLRQAQ